jgi:hypothetical protein
LPTTRSFGAPSDVASAVKSTFSTSDSITFSCAVRAQARGQVAVQLDDREAAQALHQRLREGGEAGADLHHGLARLRRDLAHDGVDDAGVGQEVLAEALAGDVLHGFVGSQGKMQPQALAAVASVHMGGSRYST